MSQTTTPDPTDLAAFVEPVPPVRAVPCDRASAHSGTDEPTPAEFDMHRHRLEVVADLVASVARADAHPHLAERARCRAPGRPVDGVVRIVKRVPRLS